MRIKKNAPSRAVREKRTHRRRTESFSAQSEVACDCQQQNPLFSNYKRKPPSVIKLPHRPLSKPKSLNHFYLYPDMITEMGIKKQEKFPLPDVTLCR
jgi:hypothetical protein